MVYIFTGVFVSIAAASVFTPVFESRGSLADKIEVAELCMRPPFELYLKDVTLKAMLVFMGIYGFGILMYENSQVNRRVNEEYGSAKWGDTKRICRKYSDKDFFKNRLLTQNLRISETGKSIYLNLITLLIGGSGAGKSFFYCIPNILQGQGSYVILDPSGELLKRTGVFLKRKGYHVRELNLDVMEESFGINPFRYIDSDDDILRLGKNIFKATVPKESHSSDPMWDNQAEALCMAYMFLIYYEASESEKSLRTLMYLAREDTIEEDEDGNLVENAVMALFKKVEIENPDHIAVRFRKTAMKGAAKTLLGVQTTLMGRLNKFNLESVCKLTDYDEMEFYRISKEPTALFLVTPAEDKSFNFLVSMVYTQLIPILYKQARANKSLKLDVPVHFIMEEAANVTLPDDFLTILTTARKHGISFSIIVQAVSQLKMMFPKDQFNTVIGSADEFVYLGSGEFETQKYISERIGKETIMVRSFSNTKGMHGSYSESNQPAGRALMDAAEVDTELGEHRALVKLRGNRWIIDEKINPKMHPNYKYTSDMTGEEYAVYDKKNVGARIQLVKDSIDSDITIDVDTLSDKIYEKVRIITDEQLELILKRGR